jgi:hypothetical protein
MRVRWVTWSSRSRIPRPRRTRRRATERFALIVDSGSPPDSLIDALAANVRKQEGSFEWVKIGEPEDAGADGDTGGAPGDAR